LALFRLMTSSNFVGWSTGKSPGLLPLRIFIDEAGDATEVVGQGHSIGHHPLPRSSTASRLAQVFGLTSGATMHG
jgi:hypothetical protein